MFPKLPNSGINRGLEIHCPILTKHPNRVAPSRQLPRYAHWWPTQELLLSGAFDPYYAAAASSGHSP